MIFRIRYGTGKMSKYCLFLGGSYDVYLVQTFKSGNTYNHLLVNIGFNPDAGTSADTRLRRSTE
jgi:hypothetical protein